MTFTSTDHDMKAMEGSTIPKHYKTGFLIASCLVSYLGALTTLELLMRRTAMRGLYNWSLLIGASISMGGIAIWSMHYIGNYAIILGQGEPNLQIVYSPSFTALSFFVPIVILFLAFMFVGTGDKASILRITIGGTLTGFAVCGMHYISQAGISNYTCIYKVAFVVLSAIIAVFDSIVALAIFFKFCSQWNASWWKRSIVAVVLSVAVSGMHWLASVETDYRLKTSKLDGYALSPQVTVILVAVFSFLGCATLFTITVLAQAKRIRFGKRASQIVLATAIFDEEGKLLVTPQGLLPAKKITETYLSRSMSAVFSVAHPAFIWIYRTTCNWAAVTDLIPKMRTHLQQSGIVIHRVGSNVEDKLLKDTGTPIEDYLLLFRELFCVAAANLADELRQPIEEIGMLYDDIVITGLKDGKESKSKRKGSIPVGTVDIEHQVDPFNLGKGQVLFLVRSVNRHEAEHLTATGFRFGPLKKVVPIIADGLLIGPTDITLRLNMMRDYASGYQILDKGVHFALFAIRASISAGFDILARKDVRNLLPTVQLPYERLEPWQLDYLKQMERMSVAQCIKFLHKASMPSNPSPMEREFAKRTGGTLEVLRDEINDFFFNDAILITDLVPAPCRGETDDSPPGTCQLIVFRIIVPIHSRAPGKKLAFTPMSLFKAQQQVYRNSPDHDLFSEETHREFAPIVGLISSTAGTKDFEVGGDLQRIAKSATTFMAWRKPVEARTFVDDLVDICIKTKESVRV